MDVSIQAAELAPSRILPCDLLLLVSLTTLFLAMPSARWRSSFSQYMSNLLIPIYP
jgi:hypothetical protein